MRCSVPLLLAVLSLAIFCAPALAERRVALVIGNGAYNERYFGRLDNPANDAKDMAATLRRLGFEVMHKQNASHREMEEAIRELGGKLKPGVVGLFYFAGHGIQHQGKNYLIPVNAGIKSQVDLEFQTVHADRVLAEMGAAANGFNIVILDACRSNPDFPGSTRSGRDAGLAEMKAPKGALIAYATSPGSSAADGAGRNGTYTASLLRHMTTPGLPVELLFKQVRMDVAKATGEQQIPWEHSSLMGEFYFAKGAGLASVNPGVKEALIARPGTAGVELGDLDASAEERAKIAAARAKAEAERAKVEAAARGEWEARLKAMQADYGKLQGVDRDPRYSPGERAKAWERFLAAYAEKNPFFEQDSSLRDSAKQQLQHWTSEDERQKKAALARPAVRPSSGAVARSGEKWVDPVTEMAFVWVPGGSYEMGCGEWAKVRGFMFRQVCPDDQLPAHAVTVSGFWMGKYEVTWEAWNKVMGRKPSMYGEWPAVNVSWADAQVFVRRLNAMGSARFRLPTEAEWEYAARSGGRQERCAGSPKCERILPFEENRHPVTDTHPNGLGLHGMSGHVGEWCEDVYAEDAYAKHSADNPVHAGPGDYRVVRGPAVSVEGESMNTLRSRGDVNLKSAFIGLRLVRLPD